VMLSPAAFTRANSSGRVNRRARGNVSDLPVAVMTSLKLLPYSKSLPAEIPREDFH
jgi:hypothetical protein